MARNSKSSKSPPVRVPPPARKDLKVKGDTHIESAQEYSDRFDQGLEQVEKDLNAVPVQEGGAGLRGWQTAGDIVKKVRPVPWLLWNIIHSVYGKVGELGSPDPMMFSPVTGLLLYAAGDKTFNAFDQAESSGPSWEVKLLSEAIGILGEDVAAAVCFVHAVCRRVSNGLPERVWRPILDDALLRARIGYVVGGQTPALGPGRGMLSGFAGRCGLAIQVASGDSASASKALTGLASGKDMSKVCAEVYGCDPLQVAAVSLISGGCNHDIALGIATYNSTRRAIKIGSDQSRWLAAFDVVENLRMGRAAAVNASSWEELGFDETSKEYLNKLVSQLQRVGHGWRWMIKALTNMENEPPPKSPQEIREEKKNKAEKM